MKFYFRRAIKLDGEYRAEVLDDSAFDEVWDSFWELNNQKTDLTKVQFNWHKLLNAFKSAERKFFVQLNRP